MSARLLWVDDEIDLLRPHCLFLEKRGYDITTASNGNDAVELCRTQRFDLVLLDENMPGLSGLETLAAVKEVQPDVPVVMVTKNEAEHPPPRDRAGTNRIGLSPRVCPTRP